MTKLDAVNLLLDGIGEDRVNSLDTGYVEATQALKVLLQTSSNVQAQGWYFNRDMNLPLHADDAGEVPLPLNILSVEFPPDSDYVQRGLRVYDRKDHTYVIKKDVACNIIVELDFCDLPASARNYIIARATAKFQTQILGSQTLSGFEQQDESQAHVNLLEDEAQNANYNIFNNTYIQIKSYRGV